MAKFRRNYNSNKKTRGSLASYKIIIFGVVTIILLFYLAKSLQFANWDFLLNKPNSIERTAVEERFYLPSSDGETIHHTYYSLSYIEDWEQAEWVAYELNVDMLNGQRVKRAKRFKGDPLVSTRSANEEQYIRSGYTRGHLVPAADMAFSELAMNETFYTSNISPQKENCNGGIWRELEENVRDWARMYGKVYVVTGPVLEKYRHSKLQRSKISIPKKFFKIVLIVNDDITSGIGFVIPNKKSTNGLKDYMLSIDEIEGLTGTDYFESLLDDKLEQKIESGINVTLWPIDHQRFNRRITKWHK